MFKMYFWLVFIMEYFLICTSLNAQVCGKWNFGYVPTYTQNPVNGSIDYLEASDYAKLSHIGHLGPYVMSNGDLNMQSNSATNIKLERGVLDAHNNNVPILLSFQAWYNDYLPALADPTSRANLINNVLALLDQYGYDGLDVDLEPIMSPWVAGIQSGNPNYVTFINTLYDSLQTRVCPFTNQKPLLAVAANGYAGPVLNQLQSKFDMINIMTYDLAGPYPGWVTWHDAPVYDGGNRMPSTGQLMPSVNGELQTCISSGVSPAKLGVGVIMDAFRWRGGDGTPTGGVTAPMQSYTTDPQWTRFSYSTFILNYYNPTNYEFDDVAKMSYLSIDNPGSENDEFWSYNDQYSCIEKVDYVWQNNLGGTMIWELKSGYIPSYPPENRIPQLNFIYDQHCANLTALPIHYSLKPTCQYSDKSFKIEWATFQENNLSQFEISVLNTKDNSWKVLDMVIPKGSGSHYFYDLSNSTESYTAYRICSKDFDGKISDCEVITCYNVADEPEINVFPNPVYDILNLEFEDRDENFSVMVYNALGKLMLHQSNVKDINFSALESGVYFLNLFIKDRPLKIYKVVRM